MQIKNEEFKKIMEHVRDELLKDTVKLDDFVAVSKSIIAGIPASITLDSFLQATGEKKERAKRVENPDDRGFLKLWDTYPASPNFIYRNVKFKGSRPLRSNYAVCEGLYLKSLAVNPNLTPDAILKALERQKKLAYEESFASGDNKLNYWNGFEVWLRQEKFIAFISDDEDVSESSSAEHNSDNNSNFA